jgi:hydroxymethylpyrimidine/phosphomethylpyrimidine kinase
MIRDQMCAVFDDLGVDAAKTGMLATQAIIETVAEQIASYSSIPLVVDPVMVSTSGARLLEESAIDALKQHLFPLASVITPNIPEAEILLQFPITPDNMAEAARQLGQRYAIPAVLLKGGHLDSDNVINVLYLNHTDRIVRLTYPRITSHNTHGTGCTLAAALATRLADPACTTEKATQDALDYVHGAILGAAHWRLGKGHGPTHFFWQYHEETD